MKNILLIKNTEYHFEVLLALYQTIKNIGYNPIIYEAAPDVFCQHKFLQTHNLSIKTDHDISDIYCGIIVSTYPNPTTNNRDPIPYLNDPIFDKLKRIIYLTHRFKYSEDFTGFINSSNTISLSPLSKKVNIDHLHLLDYPFSGKNNFDEKRIKLTVQSHFQYKNRNPKILLNIIEQIQNKIHINIIGTHTDTIYSAIPKSLIQSKDITFSILDSVTEHKLYEILINYTDFIVNCFDSSTRYSTYYTERYSTNFCHSMCLNKPIICHEFFQNIHHIPGIYYSNKLPHTYISNKDYDKFIYDFSLIKPKLYEENINVFDQKIQKL